MTRLFWLSFVATLAAVFALVGGRALAQDVAGRDWAMWGSEMVVLWLVATAMVAAVLVLGYQVLRRRHNRTLRHGI